MIWDSIRKLQSHSVYRAIKMVCGASSSRALTNASFDKREDACDYAEDFAKNKAGSTVLIQDEGTESHKIL